MKKIICLKTALSWRYVLNMLKNLCQKLSQRLKNNYFPPQKIMVLSLVFLASSLFLSNTQAETLVETALITRGSINNTRTFIGSIHFIQSSILASKTQGMVLKVNFDTTDQVQKGDVLVELDHEILDSRIKAIQATIKELKFLEEKSAKDLRRYKKLVQQKNVSQQKYDEIYYEKSRLDQKLIASEAELEALLIERKQSIITAPFNGDITQRHVELGEWVDMGGKIATLVNPKKITSLFDIPASYALNIKTGQTLTVQIADRAYPGVIEGIILKGDDKSRTFPLKINLHKTNTRLFDGMEAQIALPRTSTTKSLLVPRDAIIKRFGNDVIFVVNKNKAKMYPVTIENIDGSIAAIAMKHKDSEQPDSSDELKVGMQVITKGNERIFPEQIIKLK